MKKSHCFNTTNIFSELNGTYRKLDNIQYLPVPELNCKNVNNILEFDLSKKYFHTEKLSSLKKTITKFFLKEKFYSNGSKICNDEFIFDNKF